MSRYPNEHPDDFMKRMMRKTMGKKGSMTKAASRFMTQAQKMQKENKQAEKY